jgi:Domain of unknown function (DUF5615)
VRVLLDENLPHDLAAELASHEVVTVQGLGWAGCKNGELLRRANGKIGAFVTMDRTLWREHNLTALSFGVVLLLARSNRIQDLRPLARGLLDALGRISPGSLERVGGG